MTELRLFSDTSVMFNAQSMGDVNHHDPVVVLTGYIPVSMVQSSAEALKHRCKVQSDLRDIYRDVWKKYKENSKAFYDGTLNEKGLEKRVKEDMEKFFKTEESDKNPYAIDVKHSEQNHADITELVLRSLLRQRCHYVGFAAGESKEREPKRSPPMAYDKIKNGHIAVNRGGNVTVYADEQIDTGDYVVIDFNWDDFKKVCFPKESDPDDPNKPMKLMLKSFKCCAKRCMRIANRLRFYDQTPQLGGAETMFIGLSRGIKKDDVEKEAAPLGADGKYTRRYWRGFIKQFASLAPGVIGQCKSGCTVGKQNIDVKLESHIDKRHFDLEIHGMQQDGGNLFVKPLSASSGVNNYHFTHRMVFMSASNSMRIHAEYEIERMEETIRMYDAERDSLIITQGQLEQAMAKMKKDNFKKIQQANKGSTETDIQIKAGDALNNNEHWLAQRAHTEKLHKKIAEINARTKQVNRDLRNTRKEIDQMGDNPSESSSVGWSITNDEDAQPRVHAAKTRAKALETQQIEIDDTTPSDVSAKETNRVENIANAPTESTAMHDVERDAQAPAMSAPEQRSDTPAPEQSSDTPAPKQLAAKKSSKRAKLAT